VYNNYTICKFCFNNFVLKEGRKETTSMTDLKKKINYTVVCIAEFADRFDIAVKDAFNYLYKYQGIAFLKEHYDIEHTLSIDDAIDDLIIVCSNNGGYLK